MRSLLLFIGLALAGPSLQAQLNESDTAGFQMDVGLRASVQQGNVELLRIVPEASLLKSIGKAWAFKSQNEGLYQEIFGFKADMDLLSRNFLYYQPGKRIYPYAIAFVSTNFRRAISLRSFSGLGLSYRIIQAKGHQLKLSSNLAYERSSFNQSTFNLAEYDGDKELISLLSTTYVEGLSQLAQAGLQLSYALYMQHALNNKGVFRYQIALGLRQKLGKWLFLQSKLDYSYESLVVQSVKQHDLIWTWGLGLKIKSL